MRVFKRWFPLAVSMTSMAISIVVLT